MCSYCWLYWIYIQVCSKGTDIVRKVQTFMFVPFVTLADIIIMLKLVYCLYYIIPI